MPTYEYMCKDPTCNHEWEEEQKISEDPKTKCPKCEQETAQRLISRKGGFILNGPRWAKSLYT